MKSVIQEEEPDAPWLQLPHRRQALHGGKSKGHEIGLDPAAYLENNEWTDFSEMRPKWFIEVCSNGYDK